MSCDESKGYKKFWYSFDFGLAHFIIIDTETDFEDAPASPESRLNGGNFVNETGQLAWFENDLLSADENRKKVPWILASEHRPLYGNVPQYKKYDIFAPDDNCIPCRPTFGVLMFNYSVDFYFNGHVHWYERLCQVGADGHRLAKNYTQPGGSIHVTTGAGGADEGLNFVNITANASAILRSEYGYAKLEIKNSSSY